MISITPAPNSFVPDFFLPHTQRGLYLKLQQTQGRDVATFVIKEGEITIGSMSLVVYPLFKNLNHVYIPYGPVLIKESLEVHGVLQVFMDDFAKEHNAVFTRLDFWNPAEYLDAYDKLPAAAYNAPYFQPRGEMVLDISPEPDALLANMHKKTRYNIKKSERSGLETKIVTGSDIAIWADTFVALNEQNTASHGTTTHPKQYFKELFALLAKSEDHFIAITEKESHVVAINIFVVFGDYAYCPFGASNDIGKKLGAYYHIKWQSMLHMKERGVKTFNWGGVSVSEKDSYLDGVTKFKTGFGGEIIEHNPIVQIVHKPLWNKVYLVRKRLQRLKSHVG